MKVFTVEIKVNGTLVGHINGENVSDIKGLSTYNYEYYEVDSIALKLVNGRVKHNHKNGIRALIKKVLEDMEK